MLRHKPRLIAGVSLAALAAAAPFALSLVAEQSIRTGIAGLPGVTAERVHVSALSGAVTVEGISAGAARIGRIRASAGLTGWTSAAFAQAGSYTIESISWSLNPVTIEIPAVTFTGASFAKEDIARIFSMDAGMPERLKGLSAAAISVPLARFSVAVPDVQSMSYELKGIAADKVEGGRIARLSMAGGTFTAKDKNITQSGTIGRSEISGLNLTQGARVYFDVARPGEKPAPLYDTYTGEGMTQTITGMVPVDLQYGRFDSKSFRARPLQGKSLAALIAEGMAAAATAKDGGKGKATEKEMMSKFFASFSDAIDAFEDDGLTIENIRFSVGDKSNPVASGAIKSIKGTYGNATNGAGFAIADTEIKAPDVSARLALLSMEGYSYAPIFKALAEAAKEGDVDFKAIDPRKFMPKLGTTTIRGLEIDAPDPKSPKGVKPERINVKLGSFVFAAKDQIKGIPTDLSFGLDNLALKLPQNSADEGIKTLKALGYSALDMSAKIAAKWNEARNEVALSEISVSGKEMGAARISGVIGNIGRDVFEADLTMAQVALMGATAKGVSLKVDNAGLAEKILAMVARQQNRKPDDLRKELGGVAAMGIPAVLGPSDEAKAVANAVAKFLTRPKSLSIDVTAKNAGGIGIPDMVMVGDPQKAMGLVNIKATATD